MKTSGHLILYISENEDFELWKVLTQISPEERTAFVKSALKRALISNVPRSSNNTRINNIQSTENKKFDTPVNVQQFSYQAAATQEVDEEDDQLQFDELFLSPERRDDSTIPGLDFLLNNVIGEEDDEMVIEFIKNRMTEDDEDE
ncbi:MAG: hypothetical protein APF84_14090 [Gracilibacter sp. BRH_c7a]|nr:MAG: hypothetical protein APF84_14090 [Gracilibacter sp. BRH_c7a]